MALGATREQAIELCGEPEAEQCPVYPENWDAVVFFLKVQTQWRRGPMGGLDGLRYSGVESAMRMTRLRNRSEMFEKLVIMEHAALEAQADG